MRLVLAAGIIAIARASSGEPADPRLDAPSFGNVGDRVLVERYAALNALLVDGKVIPGLHQRFVPQGVTFLSEHPGRVVISGYFCHRLSSRLTHIIRVCVRKRSALYLFDIEQDRALRLALLEHRDGEPMRLHAGGVAELHGRLWLPDNFVVFRFNLSALTTAGPDVIAMRPENERPIGVDSSGDFVTARGDTLWVGNFQRARRGHPLPGHYRSPGNGTRGWSAGYRIDPDTLRPVSQSQYEVSFAGRKYSVYRPDFALHHRNRVQGMSFLDADRVVLSASYGGDPSALSFHELTDPATGEPVVGNEVSLPDGSVIRVPSLGKLTRRNVIHAPPGTEGVAFDGKLIAVAFEGGAMPYRLRWSPVEDRLLLLVPPARRR